MAVTLESLIQEGKDILQGVRRSDFGDYVDYDNSVKWGRKSLMFIQQQYPSNPQTQHLERLVLSINGETSYNQRILAILEAFYEINPIEIVKNYDAELSVLFERFHVVARQLKRRYANRGTLEIKDEYDVQDLLNAELLLFFNDVRPEEWTPSYAGGCNRIDFLIKDEEIAIEVKMTRPNLKDKDLGEQLLIDIAKYKEHPNCKCLYCFVYDPDGFIRNPRGIEKDLDKNSKEAFKVKTFIRPL